MTITKDRTASHLSAKEVKDLKVLALFTAVHCRSRHDAEKAPLEVGEPGLQGLGMERFHLCSECREFLDYAFARRLRCPLDPKPTCKHCHVHCYRPGHREKVREIMRFSGRHLILSGRLDLLWHYFFQQLREAKLFLTLFIFTLATAWLIFVLVAFCPLRAFRRRREIEECEEV